MIPLLFLLSETSIPSSTSSTYIVTSIMRRNDKDHQRSRRSPLVLPSFDLEVQSTDVDAAASLLDGMTIVPTPSVMSFASTTIPTPTSWSDA